MAGPRRFVTLPRERLRVLAVVVFAFIPLAGVEALVLSQQSAASRETVIADRLALARAAAATADSYIGGNLATLRALAQTESVRGATAATANAILAPILRADQNWVTVALSAADGRNVSSFSTPPGTVSIADRDYFQRAIRGELAVGSVIIARALGVKTVVLAVPIERADGTRGVLSGALSLAHVEEQLRLAVPSPNIRLRVADSLGQEFIGPEATNDALPVVAELPEIRPALAGQTSAEVVRTTDGRELLVSYAPAPRARWAIGLSEPAVTAFAVADRVNAAAATLTIAGLAAALLVAWFFAARLARSYEQVEHARSDAEAARAEAEAERFRLYEALRRAPARVGLLRGPELVYAVVSPEQLDGLGLREAEVIGKKFSDLDPEPRNLEIVRRVYQTGEPYLATETRTVTRRPDGTEREGFYNAAVVPTRAPDGTIDGVIYYGVEVTDLVRGRKLLEDLASVVAGERDELQQIIDELPEGVAIVRKNGPPARNRAAARLLGLGAQGEWTAVMRELTPRTADGAPAALESVPVLRALLRGEEVHAEEQVLRNAETDAPVNVLVSAAPVRRGGEIVAAVAVFQDITAIKAFEAQRTEFFSMASHEIRTPVAAIQLQLQLAERVLQRGEMERVPELIAGALRRTRALGALISDLLDVSRIDAGRLELELEELDLREIVGRVAGEFPTDDTHRVRVVAPASTLPVRADRRRLTEVLENLLSNAVKYSPDGGDVVVELGTEAHQAYVRVRDQGIGVPPEERARVFERFFRTTRARAYGGAGLGLYISREMVQRLGGDLLLETTSDEGSTFRLTLPLARVEVATT